MKGIALALIAATMAFGPVGFASVASAQQVDGVNCKGAWKKIHRQYVRCFERGGDNTRPSEPSDDNDRPTRSGQHDDHSN